MSDKNHNNSKLGTFGGVFTPSILTILGVIMYLRFGWVVGNVGLIGSLIIVTLSTSITFLTSLSIASIATDQKVKIGGAYYMISRSMGVETGGAVGIPLFIAQTLSISLYTLGFAESVAAVFPQLDETMVGLIVTVFIGAVALTSASVAIKTQYFILTAIAISLISLVFGKPLENSQIEMWGAKPSESESFWIVFAVFFPAVTGIMAGVNLSGDLKDPGKSIPRGTFLAVGVGYLVYMLLPLVLASRVDAITLVEEPLIMRKIAWWGDAILLGLWGATLSSALGSMLGAPRVLQALARDRVLPGFLRWVGKGSKSDDTPRAGTIFSLVIALVAVYLGNLNLIAPILTMFFLTTYGVLNFAAGVERFLGNPSFRPTFKVHWVFNLLGAIGCIAVMLLVNAIATGIAIVFVILVFIWLESRELKTNWGDIRRGIWMAITRMGLLQIKSSEEPKNWYPHILVLSGSPKKRWHLIDIADSLVQNRGLMTVATIVSDETLSLDRQQKMEKNIREFLLNKGIKSMARVITAPDPYEGSKRLVESYGLGVLYPNTVILGDSFGQKSQKEYCEMIRNLYMGKRNIFVVRENQDLGFGQMKRIDIWSAGLKGNGALMIILAHLLKKSSEWSDAQITLKISVPSESAAEDAKKNLDTLISSRRIEAEKEVIVSENEPFEDTLHESSGNADLVILGLAPPEENFEDYYDTFRKKTDNLPSTIYVLAGQDINFAEVLT